MTSRITLLALVCMALGARPIEPQAAPVEKGSFTLHMMLHAIGEEHYEMARAADGTLSLSATADYSDRRMKRTVTATLRMAGDFSPENFDLKSRTATSVTLDTATPRVATVKEDDVERKVPVPSRYFVGSGYMPFSVQMAMMRYWLAHGKPARLPILRADPAWLDAVIEPAGKDSITIAGKPLELTRYTIANVVFGREVVWLNPQGELAAAMTFAAGLPMEAVRTEYEPAFSELVRAGVAQEMADLAALERVARPEKTGAFAITGATLVDGTDHAPVPDAVVIVRDARIAAAGPRSQVTIPRGMAVVEAAGQTLLPGLWEMHTHLSGVEFGPAYLAAGVTTARDCGGEFEFLVAERDAVEKRHGLGPRLLLAGIVDSGPDAFGAVNADTPEEARAVVARYHAAGFQQIKLYTYLKPEIIKALSDEAHRVGMTVTGHVPQALNAIQGVEAGMDQINHLNYVTTTLRAPGGGRGTPMDVNSEAARKSIQFFLDHHTVVDPTAGWGEMAGHPKSVDIASFEPGILKAPQTLVAKFNALGGANGDAAQLKARNAQTGVVIGALFKAGIPIVPGSDTGLIGYGLQRELELYVEAGMTPLQAIQSATIVSARAMKLENELGTIEAGKRADLILVNGNPLANISDIRKVTRVVANGYLYDSATLWRSVGFKP
jgi:imidazolonepropionase-like amidohydrolase